MATSFAEDSALKVATRPAFATSVGTDPWAALEVELRAALGTPVATDPGVAVALKSSAEAK